MPEEPVVVVGAGPVGLTAALLLARLGLPVLLLERHRRPYPLPRAVHLDDEAFRVLQAAGVAEEVAAVCRPMAGLRLLDPRHRVLAEFARPAGVGPHGWPRGSLFHQPDLEAVLRRAVAGSPSIRQRPGAEVVGLVRQGAAPALLVRDGATAAREVVPARAVVGCDGANSTLRTLIGARMRNLGPADRWLVVDGRGVVEGAVEGVAEGPVWPGVHQVADPRRPATFLPVTGDRFRWEFRLLPGETAAELADGARLAPLIAGFGVADVLVERAAEYVFRAQVADRWRSGRMFLAGDAAHLTPPFIGQGLGLGLRDVHQLAWRLARVLAGEAGEELLDGYQAERAAHARSLIRLALLLGRLMTGGGRGSAVVRRGVLAAVRRLPAVTALASAGRTPPLPSGPSVRRRGRAGRRVAGTLLPQPEVTVEGRRCRLDDALGAGWARLRPAGPATVLLGTAPGWTELADAGDLVEWMRRAGAAEVLVRPDRVVAAARSTRRRDRSPRSRPGR